MLRAGVEGLRRDADKSPVCTSSQHRNATFVEVSGRALVGAFPGTGTSPNGFHPAAQNNLFNGSDWTSASRVATVLNEHGQRHFAEDVHGKRFINLAEACGLISFDDGGTFSAVDGVSRSYDTSDTCPEQVTAVLSPS